MRRDACCSGESLSEKTDGIGGPRLECVRSPIEEAYADEVGHDPMSGVRGALTSPCELPPTFYE